MYTVNSRVNRTREVETFFNNMSTFLVSACWFWCLLLMCAELLFRKRHPKSIMFRHSVVLCVCLFNVCICFISLLPGTGFELNWFSSSGSAHNIHNQRTHIETENQVKEGEKGKSVEWEWEGSRFCLELFTPKQFRKNLRAYNWIVGALPPKHRLLL